MLSLNLFKKLSKREQADLLQFKGTYLDSREEPEFIIDLYELEGFYVEVYYHKSIENLIAVKCFQAGDDQKASDTETNTPPYLYSAWNNPYWIDIQNWYA